MEIKKIRNFSIIAHIDHGKTTLSDRLLHMTGTISDREMENQLLDSMDLEKERGITIKAHPVTMYYKAKDGEEYELNLIDTPGHVDFTYEVSRSLSACEGALLIIDAAQGVEAQTVANVNLAMNHNLTIIPVINKIDLPHADISNVKKQLEDILAIPSEEAVLASAKEGTGIENVLESIIKIIPHPKEGSLEKTQALVFDSYFDSYRGVVAHLRVFSGIFRAGMQIKMLHTNKTVEIKEVGSFNPKPYKRPQLGEGETGYVTANIKSPSDVKIGDTLTDSRNPANALPGFQEIKPMVFSGIYPINSADYEHLKSNLAKLQLNDSAFFYQAESSAALGFGFRCGFLGLLHLEIISERLEREFDINLLTTTPGVVYKVHLNNGDVKDLQNPSSLPDPTFIKYIEEPWIKATIITPDQYLGPIIKLCQNKRGIQTNLSYSGNRAVINYEIPLNEVVFDFNDRLKSMTSGYASFDYEIIGHREGDLVKMSILVNSEPVDALAMMIH